MLRQIYNNMAISLSHMDRLDEAVGLYEKAQNMAKELFGPNSDQYFETLLNRGTLLA